MHSQVSRLAEIRLYDEVLSAPLFSQLRQAVLAIGDEKPDGKDTYSKTFWFSRGSSPTKCQGMEWWIGRLKRGKKLAFHFDRDLSLSRKTGQSVFPMLSSVFYLNQFDSSPTVLLDQVPGEDGTSKIPEKARLSTSVMAIPNQYLVFPGKLRHGVIPDVSKIDRDNPNEYRLTLLVNYWERRPSAPICCDYDGSVYKSLCNG